MLQPRVNRGKFMHTICCVFLIHVATSHGIPKVLPDDRMVQNQRFAMEPQDQTAIVGSRVTLPCRVINKQGTLQWTKDDFGLGTHRNLSGFERYSMIGSDEEGDFSLDVYPVMLDDDAKYQCQVGPGSKGKSKSNFMTNLLQFNDNKQNDVANNVTNDFFRWFILLFEGQPGIRSRFATLTILVPPEQPKILQGDFMVTTEGREIELECISVGGKPAAEVRRKAEWNKTKFSHQKCFLFFQYY